MDGLKKNLHFVVLGVGALLGVVLMVAGMMIKSGKQDEIDAAVAALSKHTAKNSALPTKKDTELAKRKKDAFEGELKGSLAALESGAGLALKAGRKDHRDGPTFFSSEGDAAVKDLQKRFEAMDREIKLPPELGDRKLPAPTQPNTFWENTLKGMNQIADPKQIPNFQVQIRVMQEVCFVCERLLQQAAFRDQGVKLVEFKWEFSGDKSVGPEQPWEEYPFAVILECQPGFATALADELANPSKRTIGDPAKAKEGQGRWGFPVDVFEMQTEVMERAVVTALTIYNKDKAAYGIPAEAKADDQVVLQKKKELEDKLWKELQLVLPVRCGIKAKALAFNKEWRGVKAAAETNG